MELREYYTKFFEFIKSNKIYEISSHSYDEIIDWTKHEYFEYIHHWKKKFKIKN